MYKLYYMPGACSMAVHVALNEIGAEFSLVKGFKDDWSTPEESLLKVNPCGAVPVLDDDGFIIREGAAILQYLLDKHNSPLLPRDGKERTIALEWLAFCNATLHPAYGKAFFVKKNVKDAKQQDELYSAAFAQIEKLWAEIDARLAKNKYITGNKITAADILMTVIANWNTYFTKPIKIGPNVKRLLKEVVSRPSYVKALAAEQVEYKVAA